MAYNRLPLKIDGRVINHKHELKDFMLQKKPYRTLFSAYQFMIRENDQRDFADYVDAYCEHFGITNPYDIQPLNTRSRGWREIVQDIMGEETTQDVINHVLSIALSDSRNSIKACELLAQWQGITAKQEVKVQADIDANVDAKVSVNPDLFDLPDASD